MTLKTVLKWLPRSLIISVLITTIVASFDGVILSAVISNVTKFNSSSTSSDVFRYIGLSVSGFVLVYSAMIVNRLLKNRAVKIMNTNLKRDFIFGKLQNAKFNEDTSDSVSQIFNDFKLVENQYFALVFELLSAILTGVVSAIYILTLNLPVGILFILFSLLPMMSSKFFGKQLTETAETWQTDSGRFLGKVTDLFRGINSIRTYRAQKAMFQDAVSYLNTEEASYERMNNKQVAALFVTFMLSLTSFLAPLGIGLFFVVNGQIAPAVIIGIFLASDRVVGPLRNAAQFLNMMKATEKIRNNLVVQEVTFEPDSTENVTEKANLVIDTVDFDYGNGKNIVNHLSLNVPFGSKLLISGNSGNGKSTILNLIQGFLKPTKGTINIDGKNVSSSDTIAYIQQSPFLFSDTLRFNLTLGKDFNDTELLDALNRVGLVDELGPDLLDKTFGESGTLLSGGQRQRVEIARALLYNKKIILLDEATSNLDKSLAKQIHSLVWTLPCTVIEVAHNFDEQELQDNGIKHLELRNGEMQAVV